MEIRETIGIALLIIGFITSFFNPAGVLLIFVWVFIYGKNRLALILLAGGLRGMFQSNTLLTGLVVALIGGGLLAKSHYFPYGFSLTESGKRKRNPFTGKKTPQ